MASSSQWSGQATIGVDVGGSYVKGVIADADGRVVSRVRRPSGRHAGPDAVLEATFATLDAAISAVPERLTLGAAGVAVPGVVDDGAGVVRWTANLGWRDLPIRALIEEHTDLPVWCGHDVHAGGVAEFRHGAGWHATAGVFVPVGTVIAAALLIGGRSHRGGGLAGEIGHLDVGHGGPCRCGRTGCLEVIASAASIVRRYAERTNTITEGAAQVAQRVRAGEAAAPEVWQDALHALSFALSWLGGVLAPDVVVLGGGLGRAGDLLLQPLRASLTARFTYQHVPNVVCAEFGDEAGAVGAALLARAAGAPERMKELTMRPVAMGPAHRRSTLQRLSGEQFDVLVVGGGIVGAGAALDAVSRGLSVALVEARDWASGTSSRSSKLIHGGLRYLEQGNVALVREALRERSLLVNRLAPHLVRPVAFLLPVRHRLWQRAYFGAGLMLYDAMGGARAVPRHRHLSRRAAARRAPGLRPDALIGAITYHDAQVDDARLALTVVRTAVSLGTAAASGVLVDRMRTGPGGGVCGASAVDTETGSRLDIRARTVISATGVWTDDIQRLLHRPVGLRVRASKGVHIVVPRERIDIDTGLLLPTEKSVLFVIPWGAHWLIGTTDTDWSLDKADPAVSGGDIDYLLKRVNAVLRTPITRADIEGVYAGLRPLVAGGAEQTAKLSREHCVVTPVPGLTVIAGGKLTTYRVMAKDAVDAAARDLGAAVPDSVTDQLPLLGADGFPGLWHRRHFLASSTDLPVTVVERLLRRYGWCATDILDLIRADPDLGRPLDGADRYLRAEVVYAATQEDARHLDDVLTRRTRISMETPDRGAGCAAEVAALMAPTLGWDQGTAQSEIAHFLAQLQAQRHAERQPDDLSAAAAARQAVGTMPSVGRPAQADRRASHGVTEAAPAPSRAAS